MRRGAAPVLARPQRAARLERLRDRARAGSSCGWPTCRTPSSRARARRAAATCSSRRVGPFVRWGEPRACEAALAAGADYLDVHRRGPFPSATSSSDYGPRAEPAGVGPLAGFGYDYVPGNLAGALALRDAGEHAVPRRSAYFWEGGRRRDERRDAGLGAGAGCRSSRRTPCGRAASWHRAAARGASSASTSGSRAQPQPGVIGSVRGTSRSRAWPRNAARRRHLPRVVRAGVAPDAGVRRASPSSREHPRREAGDGHAGGATLGRFGLDWRPGRGCTRRHPLGRSSRRPDAVTAAGSRACSVRLVGPTACDPHRVGVLRLGRRAGGGWAAVTGSGRAGPVAGFGLGASRYGLDLGMWLVSAPSAGRPGRVRRRRR